MKYLFYVSLITPVTIGLVLLYKSRSARFLEEVEELEPKSEEEDNEATAKVILESSDNFDAQATANTVKVKSKIPHISKMKSEVQEVTEKLTSYREMSQKRKYSQKEEEVERPSVLSRSSLRHIQKQQRI